MKTTLRFTSQCDHQGSIEAKVTPPVCPECKTPFRVELGPPPAQADRTFPRGLGGLPIQMQLWKWLWGYSPLIDGPKKYWVSENDTANTHYFDTEAQAIAVRDALNTVHARLASRAPGRTE